MSNFNKDKLSELLKLALEGRTQKEFAQEIGISHEYLNRIINKKYKNPPSKDLLKKISYKSNISLEELMLICGYNKEGLKYQKEDLLFELLSIIEENFECIKNEVCLFKSKEELIENLVKNFYFNVEYDIIDSIEDKYLLTFKLTVSQKTLKLYISAEIIKTDKGLYILKNISPIKDTINLAFNIKEQDFENSSNYFYKYIDNSKYKDLKKEKGYYIDNIIGYGFKIKDIKDDIDKSFKSLSKLAESISKETGIKINYIEDDFAKENNAIIFISKEEPNIMIKEIFENYKSKYNISACGFCCIYKQKKALY